MICGSSVVSPVCNPFSGEQGAGHGQHHQQGQPGHYHHRPERAFRGETSRQNCASSSLGHPLFWIRIQPFLLNTDLIRILIDQNFLKQNL
jgi:hypothetical protein